ncbi:MAG: hypothetical protein ABS54_12815 [Hyphomicrobium sp. SCN 65-11]|nr:MAG: hypothetical protein ABS54_12815 [Hyphomicrobium sp. SCN 65-11]
MTSETPAVTIDLFVGMLKQVIEENAAHGRAKPLTAAWGRETLLDETGLNSYDIVELIFKIEDHFGIEVDYNANNSINSATTIGELCDEIGKLVAKKQAA